MIGYLILLEDSPRLRWLQFPPSPKIALGHKHRGSENESVDAQVDRNSSVSFHSLAGYLLPGEGDAMAECAAKALVALECKCVI